MTDPTPAPDPAPMSTPPLEDWATLHDRLLDAERAWKAARAGAAREQRERADRTEQAEAEQAELRTENEALRDKLAVRDRELEQARAERDRYRLARDSARRRVECLLGTLDGTQSNLDQAEAALARVRELAGQWQTAMRPDEQHPAARALLAVLDGAGQPAEEQAAPVDWQAVTRQRERELKKVGEARQRAEAILDRVRALHREADGTLHSQGSCRECGQDYPCPTLRTLDDPRQQP